LINNNADKTIEGVKISQRQQPFLIFRKNWSASVLFDREGIKSSQRKRSEIIFQEHEVDFIWDPSVIVKINFLEEEIENSLISNNVDGFKSIIKSFTEFLLAHNSLSSFAVEFLFVESLNGHFSEMLFNAEVGELVISNRVITITIISENISSDVIQLILIFLEKLNQSSLNFLSTEFFVFIKIEFN